MGIKLEESQWDQKTQKAKKNHPNSNRVNAFIAKKIAEAEAETLVIAIEGRTLSTDSFIEVKGKEKTDFFSFAEKYVDSFKNKGKIGSYKRTKYTIEKLKEYHGNQKLQFKEITVAFLKNYEAYLSGTLNNKINTIQANFKVIRTILNNAINEDIIKRDKNPFYKFKIQSEPTNRCYLTEQELANMDKLELKMNELIQLGKIDPEFSMPLKKQALAFFESAKFLYEDVIEIINEELILVPMEISKRPDKILIKEKELIVIEFKTGKQNKQHELQISSYQLALSEIYGKPILFYLYYSEIDELVRVG